MRTRRARTRSWFGLLPMLVTAGVALAAGLQAGDKPAWQLRLKSVVELRLHGSASSLAWSPDGRRLALTAAFSVYSPHQLSKLHADELGVHVVDVRSGRLLGRLGRQQAPAAFEQGEPGAADQCFDGVRFDGRGHGSDIPRAGRGSNRQTGFGTWGSSGAGRAAILGAIAEFTGSPAAASSGRGDPTGRMP